MASPPILKLDELTAAVAGDNPAGVPMEYLIEQELDAARKDFEMYWQTPQLGALDRMKLMKLAWDMVGSEFAGRQQQYEKFYAGASFIVRNHSFREAPWKFFDGLVEKLMAGYDVPVATKAMKAAE